MSILFVFVIGIGFVAGLRSLTAPAAVAWAAYLGWLHLAGSKVAFMGSIVAVCIFSILALIELVADKLPKTPSRTTMGPLIARIVTGALCGLCLAQSAHHSLAINAVVGAVGAVLGAFVGYKVRQKLVLRLKVADLVIALCEDVVAISLAIFFVSR